jgi:predicted XRE-type DNA-binding protein
MQPVVVSSASGLGYATRYPDILGAEVDHFVKDKQQAHALTGTLAQQAPKPKPEEDRGLLLRVVDEADTDGRRDSYAQAQRSERHVVAFWESERAAIGSRVGGATQKQAEAAGCTQLESQATVQQSLREGVTRQLEKSALKDSEAQRLLELMKPRLSAATWNGMQHTADDVTRASYLVYVGLLEDATELQRLVAEYPTVSASLQGAQQAEQSLQSTRLSANDLKASQSRAQQWAARLTAAADNKARAEKELENYEVEVQNARTQYEQARAALRNRFTQQQQQSPVSAKLRSTPPPPPQAQVQAAAPRP